MRLPRLKMHDFQVASKAKAYADPKKGISIPETHLNSSVFGNPVTDLLENTVGHNGNED